MLPKYIVPNVNILVLFFGTVALLQVALSTYLLGLFVHRVFAGPLKQLVFLTSYIGLGLTLVILGLLAPNPLASSQVFGISTCVVSVLVGAVYIVLGFQTQRTVEYVLLIDTVSGPKNCTDTSSEKIDLNFEQDSNYTMIDTSTAGSQDCAQVGPQDS